MAEYQYSNQYEREETQKYEGIYTPEEIELNQKLQQLCSHEPPDLVAIEALLKQGADPLGPTVLYGWDLLEHIYGDTVVCDSQDSNSIYLPQLTELFLKYGMDVGKPRIPYDNSNSISPLWHFAHTTNENAIFALKMLLDHGLSADDFADFYDHAMTDYSVLGSCIIGCCDPQNDEFWNYSCTWTFKMLLLGASYDHILDNDEGLREFICCDFNDYDVHNFRNWDDYEYYFDTSFCPHGPHLFGSILQITLKETGKIVWKIGIGKEGRKSLANL